MPRMVEECTAQTITGVPTLPLLHGFSTHTCPCLAALPGSQGPAGGWQHIRGWAPERGAGPGAGACGRRPGWASRPGLGAAHQLWEQACSHPPACWPRPTTALWMGCSLRGEPWGPSGLGGWRLSLPRTSHQPRLCVAPTGPATQASCRQLVRSRPPRRKPALLGAPGLGLGTNPGGTGEEGSRRAQV